MNKVDKEALEYQKVPVEYINDLKQYCKKRFGHTGGFLLAASCFNYGVMVGKRKERQKYKTELEKVKAENIKLKSIIYEIIEALENIPYK